MRLDDMIREDDSIDILTNSLHYFYWKRIEKTNWRMTFDISIYDRLLRTLIWRTRRHLMNLVPFCILINAFCHTAQIATDECIYLIFNKRYFGLWQLGRSGHLAAFERSPVVCLSQERQTIASQCTILNTQSNLHLISYMIAIDFIIA